MKKRDFFPKPGMTVILMIFATLLSKVLGLFRQMMVAGIFAAEMEGIAFSAASKIPLAIFDMLFSTAVIGSFLPIYKSHIQTEAMRAKRFSSSFFTVIFVVTAILALLGILFAPNLIAIAAPDLDEKTAALAAKLLAIMFPSMIFAGAAYTLIGILQSHERFLLPAFVSAVSNLVIILYLAFRPISVEESTVVGLAFAYLVSWVVQFLTLAIPLLFRKQFPTPTVSIRNADTALAFRRALPVMFGSWLIPMTTLSVSAFSSFIESNRIAENTASGAAIVVYETAFSVFSIAAGLLTYGICNYIFPKLSEKFSSGNETEFSKLIGKALFASLALILPIASALFLLAKEVISFLYLRGNFTEALVSATADSLEMLCFAMPFYGLIELFSRVCYSCGKVHFPLIASLGGIGVSFLFLSLSLMTGMLSVRTAALGSVLGQVTAASLLIFFCLRNFPKIRKEFPFGKFFYLLIGFLVCTASMWGCRVILKHFLHFSHTFQNFITIAIVFAVGFVVYLIWLFLTKIISFPHIPESK